MLVTRLMTLVLPFVLELLVGLFPSNVQATEISTDVSDRIFIDGVEKTPALTEIGAPEIQPQISLVTTHSTNLVDRDVLLLEPQDRSISDLIRLTFSQGLPTEAQDTITIQLFSDPDPGAFE